MRFLITGGAGFIGSNISISLASAGEQITILDNFSTGGSNNIVGLRDKINLVVGDIRNMSDVNKAMQNVDFVLHHAAIPSVSYSIMDPVDANSVNLNGTLNLLEAARRNQIRRFIFASSSAVYGDKPELPKRENMQLSPLSPYAVAKLAGEYYCGVYHQLYGLETVCLRYFNIFGPRQDPNSEYAAVIPKFIISFLNGKRPIIYGDGNQTRDFTFVEDVVRANISAALSPGIAGNIYNIASGKRHNLIFLTDALKQILASEIDPVFEKPRKGDILHSYADISAADRDLQFKPQIEFESGLKSTVEWYASAINL